MSADQIRELLSKYEQIVVDINNAIDKETKAKNEIAIARAEVVKYRHQLDLVKEQIMTEKKLISVTTN